MPFGTPRRCTSGRTVRRRLAVGGGRVHGLANGLAWFRAKRSREQDVGLLGRIHPVAGTLYPDVRPERNYTTGRGTRAERQATASCAYSDANRVSNADALLSREFGGQFLLVDRGRVAIFHAKVVVGTLEGDGGGPDERRLNSVTRKNGSKIRRPDEVFDLCSAEATAVRASGRIWERRSRLGGQRPAPATARRQSELITVNSGCTHFGCLPGSGLPGSACARAVRCAIRGEQPGRCAPLCPRRMRAARPRDRFNWTSRPLRPRPRSSTGRAQLLLLLQRDGRLVDFLEQRHLFVFDEESAPPRASSTRMPARHSSIDHGQTPFARRAKGRA